MAAIPTYLYFGDAQINGGTVQPDTQYPVAWGLFRNYPRFSRVVPSGADGYTGGTFEPYWDGVLGAWVKYHHAKGILNPTSGANGDNWYQFGGGITPCTLLINALWELHPSGFKLIKAANFGGFGSGVSPYKPSSATGWPVLLGIIADAEAEMGSDTFDWRGIIMDASATDIANANFSYQADVVETIEGCRDDIDADCPIFLVSHHGDMLDSTVPGASAFARGLNKAIAAADDTVVLVDMSWAQFGASVPYGTVSGTKENYTLEDYIQAGARMGRLIHAYYTDLPPATSGTGIACYAMFGDSNFVGVNSSFPFLAGTESLLGTLGGTERTGQYIWNDNTGQVELYDILANPNTFGTTSTLVGPECTFLKQAAKTHPGGVVLFKYALSGGALTIEATVAGAAGAAEASAGSVFDEIKESWQRFCAAVVRDTGRVVDLRGIALGWGGNDTYNDASAAGFASKAGIYVDDLREFMVTRSDGEEPAVCWLQPPPHKDSGFDGGTTLGARAARESVRATVASLEGQKDRLVVATDPGGRQYELQRTDEVHYAGEAIFQLGYDLFDFLNGVNTGSEGGTDTEADADVPSGSAAFVVETGIGSATANSYATTAFTDTYHQTFGNPSAWLNATLPEKQNALRVATQYLDWHYGERWAGVRGTSEQALDWPRILVIDTAGNDVDEDVVPTRLQEVTAKAALLHLQGNTLAVETSTSADISSESKSLPGGLSKSVTYIGGKPATTQFPAIERALMTAGLVGSGAGWGYSNA